MQYNFKLYNTTQVNANMNDNRQYLPVSVDCVVTSLVCVIAILADDKDVKAVSDVGVVVPVVKAPVVDVVSSADITTIISPA